MKIFVVSVVCVVALCVAAPAARAARPAVATRSAAPAPAAPVLPADTGWVKGVLVAVGALLGAALIIGPLVRASLPDELPPTHSHDEPPGSSLHHGPTGTVDLIVPERGQL